MIFFNQFLSEVGIGSFSSLRFEEEWFRQNPESAESLRQVQLTEVSRAKLGKNQVAPTLGEAGMVKAMFAHGVQSEWLTRFHELAEVAQFYLFEPVSQTQAAYAESEASIELRDLKLPNQTCVFEIRGQTLQAATLSVLIHERAPNEFEFFKISRSRSRNRLIAEYNEPEVIGLESPILLKLRHLINSLSVDRTGVDKVDVREKIGMGDARKRVGMRDLIRVSSPDSIHEVPAFGRKAIDWGAAGD